MNGNKVIDLNKRAYSRIARLYTDVWKNNIDTEITSRFLDYLGVKSVILDAGCGPGHYSEFFVSRGHSVFSIDFSMAMLNIGRNDLMLKNLVCMDIINLAFKRKQFDGLWVCASFPHIPECLASRVLVNFFNVLKDNGILFINAIIGDIPYRVETKKEINIPGLDIGRFFQWYPSAEKVYMLLHQNNFRVDSQNEKIITSRVLANAKYNVTRWINFICRKR
jgi:SAM-dependent methyltransferase